MENNRARLKLEENKHAHAGACLSMYMRELVFNSSKEDSLRN